MLIKTLAASWLDRQRKRVELGKLKPASLSAFTSYTNNWITPRLGELEAESIKNGVVKQFAEALVVESKSPKTIKEILVTLKMILRSHRDENGERLLDLSKWDTAFIMEDIPASKPKQPVISQNALNAILKNRSIKARDRVLIGLAASTGLRVGELLALKINDDADTSWSGDLIHVRKSLWRGRFQAPKTHSSIRTIEISAPVQHMLQQFAEGRTSGYMFCTKRGTPLAQAYLREHILMPCGVPGAHSLRRYRATWLEEQCCPRSLQAAWLGHSNAGNMTDRYVKSAEDQAYRKKLCEKIGTGLELAAATEPTHARSPRSSARETT